MKNKLPGALVLPHAESVLNTLAPHCQRIEWLGSLRRGKEFVGDVELLLIPKGVEQGLLFDKQPSRIAAGNELIKAVNQFNVVKGGLEDYGHMVQFFGPRRIPFDLFVAGYENFGYQKVIRTGPHEHNVGFIIPMLKSRGYELKHAHIWKGEQLIPVPEEENLYDLIDTHVISPNERQFFTKTNELK
jgi:DNA polymerase/3'-5' exonuclease PolX